MKSFANLADAGRALAALVQEEFTDASDVIVLAAIPNGAPVAIPVAAVLRVRATGLPIDRTGDGPVIGTLPDAADRVVIVIDDGVETGSVARAAAIALRELKPRRLVLAVPVCSREAMAGLARLYDEIIAVDRPLGRRALAWHYDDFDTIDDVTATRLLEAQ